MQSNTTSTPQTQPPGHSLLTLCANLTDQRNPQGVRYALAPLLALFLLAKLCHANSPEAAAEWVALRSDSLRSLLGLKWKRMPHSSTFRRLLQSSLDVSELEQEAAAVARQMDNPDHQLLNLDGKTLRGTIPHGATRGLHLLSLQQADENLVVAQVAVASKENEISAAPELLRGVNLTGRVVSGDALLAQKSLSRQIVAQGGDYLWALKKNHPTLHAQAAAYFTQEPAQRAASDERATSLDKGHGRVEWRELHSSSRLADVWEWPEVAQVFQVTREIKEIASGKERREVVYGLTSLPPAEAGAERLLGLVRSHWSIENGLHGRRDVTFKEDKCRMKSWRAGQVTAICHNLLIGVLRHLGWANLASARRYYEARVEEGWALLASVPC
jgi:predicted transposase YbfD/YdcC